MTHMDAYCAEVCPLGPGAPGSTPGLGKFGIFFLHPPQFFDPLGLSLINKYKGFEIPIATTLAGLLFLSSSFLYIISTTFVSGLIGGATCSCLIDLAQAEE